MKFVETSLSGAYSIELEPRHDDRGFFARAYCDEEFRRHGLHTTWPQCNISFNRTRGTLRGLHLQAPPHEEVKLIRCVAGAIFDVIVDLRPGSPSYLRHERIELSAANRRMLYIPAGMAHGFLTLDENTEIFYHMGAPFVPSAAVGYRWNDPAFEIVWPMEPRVISERDRSYPDFSG